MKKIMLNYFAIFLIFARSAFAFLEISKSEFAYVKLEEWKPCRNGSIQLEFKTTQENALILYTDDGGLNDFFEIKLLKGVIHLVLNLGSGKMRLAAGEYLYDNEWHKISIKRQNEKISLHVDSSSQTRPYQGKDQLFGIPSKPNNYVFLGGVSKDYQDRTNALTVETIFFEPRFTGSIRNVLFSNCGGPRFRPNVLSSLNLTHGPNMCLTKNSCVHGTCIEEDDGMSCDCSETNFKGDKCEIGRL